MARCTAGGAAVLAILVWAGMVGAANAQTGGTQASSSSNPFAGLSKRFKFTSEPGEPADFVKKTRPPADRLTYVPVGGPRAEPAGTVLDPTQVRALESDLVATRARHDRLAHRKADRTRYRSAAAEPSAPAVKKKPVKCLLTCTVTLKGSRQ